jgi:hypothetical protein
MKLSRLRYVKNFGNWRLEENHVPDWFLVYLTLRFQMLMLCSTEWQSDWRIKMISLWDIMPCSLVEVDRCFRGVNCLHHQGIYSSFTTMMMEVVHTFEASVYFYKTTQHCIPHSWHLHTHCCKNLKLHWLIHNELERMWKEVIITCFTLVSQDLWRNQQNAQDTKISGIDIKLGSARYERESLNCDIQCVLAY